MKKWGILGIIALLILGAFLIWYFAFFNNKWRERFLTYQNFRYNFGVEYPANWRLGEEPSNSDGREMVSKDENVTCRAYGFYNSLTGETGNPQTLDQYIDWILETGAETEGEKSNVLEKKESKLNERRAIYLNLQEGDQITDSIYVLGKESGIGLVCQYKSQKQRDKYRYVFDHMIETIKINQNLDGS